MRMRIRILPSALFLAAFAVLRAAPAAAADSRIAFRTGIGLENFSRTITWDDKTQTSKFSAILITGRGEIELSPGVLVDLAAGVSLSNFNGLIFRGLPISLDYEAGATAGLLLAAGVRARLLSLSNFEIEGAGRFVYSLGLTKSWALEGFAVPGDAAGKPIWMRVSAGPRLSYLGAAKFVPYLDVAASVFSGNFELAETLGDLSGNEKKDVRGKGLVEISLGADYEVSRRLSLSAEAGFLPYHGGVNHVLSAGLLFFF